MESLRSLLNRAKSELAGGWFYLPAENENWTLDTNGVLIDCEALDENEVNENDEPIYAVERKLICTLDSASIEDIVSFAGTIGLPVTDDLLLESFIYYYVHDAFLPQPGYQPLPPEEALLKIKHAG